MTWGLGTPALGFCREGGVRDADPSPILPPLPCGIPTGCTTVTTCRACHKDGGKEGEVDELCGLDLLETSGEVPWQPLGTIPVKTQEHSY